MGGILLAVEKVRSNATEVLGAAVAMASGYEHEFPCAELNGRSQATVLRAQRLRSSSQSRRQHRGRGAEAEKNMSITYIVGAWAGLFDGLRAGRYSVDLTASTLKQCRKQMSSDKERSTSNKDSPGGSTDDDDDDDSDSRSRRRAQANDRKRRRKDKR